MNERQYRRTVGYDGLCPTGKRSYETRAAAKAGRRGLSGITSVEGVHAYRCDACGFWHIGHRRAWAPLPAIECAKRVRAGVQCPAAGTHKLETRAGEAWLCETHWLELQARVRARAAA